MTTRSLSTIGLHTIEAIGDDSPFRSGRLKQLQDVEWVTAHWVDWYTTTRLHSRVDDLISGEYDYFYYANLDTPAHPELAPVYQRQETEDGSHDRRVMIRGQYRGTSARRDQIIAAAFDEFSSGGYESASLRSIAAKAGITHPGLFYHFPTKESLLTSVLREHEEAERREFFKTEPPLTAADFIRRITESFRGELGRPQLLRLRMHLTSEQHSGNDLAREFLARRYERVVGELAEQVRVLKANGAVSSSADDDDAASAIFALYDGLLMHSVSTPNAKAAEIFSDSLARILGKA